MHIYIPRPHPLPYLLPIENLTSLKYCPRAMKETVHIWLVNVMGKAGQIHRRYFLVLITWAGIAWRILSRPDPASAWQASTARRTGTPASPPPLLSQTSFTKNTSFSQKGYILRAVSGVLDPEWFFSDPDPDQLVSDPTGICSNILNMKFYLCLASVLGCILYYDRKKLQGNFLFCKKEFIVLYR